MPLLVIVFAGICWQAGGAAGSNTVQRHQSHGAGNGQLGRQPGVGVAAPAALRPRLDPAARPDAGLRLGLHTAPHPLERVTPGPHPIRLRLDAADAVGAHRVAAAYTPVLVADPGAAGTLQVHDVAIRRGAVAHPLRTIRTEQGVTVELRFTSDAPADLHLHGYDIEARVAPDSPVRMRFEAVAAGRFPVALHAADDNTGGHGQDALLYLEVYPR